MRSFMGAQINLEFSGIPDDVEVTLDAWVATAEDLEDEDFVVDQATNFNPTAERTPIAEVADPMNDQLAINSAGNLVAVITGEDNKASVLTGPLTA